jgi:hypothetical protein
VVGLGSPAATQQAGAGQFLDPDGQAHVALAGLDRHDGGPQGGGPGGAGVGDVVDRDARLADLLLQLLADSAPWPMRLPAARTPMSRTDTWASDIAAMAASAARSTVSRFGCFPNLVM